MSGDRWQEQDHLHEPSEKQLGDEEIDDQAMGGIVAGQVCVCV